MQREREPIHASHGSRGASGRMVFMDGPSQCFKQGFFTPQLLQSPLNLLNQILQWTNVDLEPLGQDASALVGIELLSWFSLE